MKRIATTALALLALVLTTNVQAKTYIVKHKGTVPALISAPSLSSSSGQAAIKLLDTHDSAQLLKIEVDQKNVISTIANLMRDGNVEYVVENFKFHRFEAPFDPNALREQWALAKVKANEAWTLAGNAGSKNILVAVIDTGVDYNHESLKDNSVPGYDFRDNDADPMDETSSRNPGHGTHCAGIVGATGTVANGTAGLSKNVSIMPIRFLGADGSGDLMAAVKALDYAVEKGARVISNSWGASVSASQAQPIIEAIKRASDAGVIVVNAAANDGKSNDTTSVYPANAKFENTISVAASGPSDAKPSWSNYGKNTVDLASPGEGIMSTIPGNKYQNLSGTSMATPLVSGMVALMLAQDDKLTGAEVRSILQKTGSQVQIETACNCRIDALGAVKTILDKELTVVPAAASLEENGSAQFAGLFGQAPFTFTSSDPAVATITDTGALTAVKKGIVKVSVTDATGKTAQSLDILIGQKSSGGGGGPGDGSCPIGDPMLCEILCGIMPDAPFCSKVQ